MARAKIQAAATYAVTLPCLFRKLLLTPFAPCLHAWLLYFMAEAARKTGAIVNQITIEPNHIHYVVTVTRANLPTFKRLFHGELGSFVKKALQKHGFEAPKLVFGSGQSQQKQLVNAAAMLVWLHYSDIQVVKDGLVEKVEHYPGFTSDPGQMAGASMILARPPFGLNPRMWPETSELRFGMVPELKRVLGTQRTIYALRKARKDGERAYAATRKRPVLGAARLLAQHPWAEPAAPRKPPKPGPVETFMVVDDDELEALCRREVKAFGEAYDEARERVRKAEPALFPAGTYLMKEQYGAEVEPPAEDSVLAVGERFEDLEEPPSTELRAALTRRVRRAATDIDPAAVEDDLATRLTLTESATVDRRDSPKVSLEDGKSPKIVTLREKGRAEVRPRASAPRDARTDGEPPDPATDN